MRLGETLGPDLRAQLNRLALDSVYHGLLEGPLPHLQAGGFPSRQRIEADVTVVWGTHRVPFPEVRRIYEWDRDVMLRRGGGRFSAVVHGLIPIEPSPGRATSPAEIDPGLASRMPVPTRAPLTPARAFGDVCWPLMTLALEGPAFRRMCAGVDVPWSPLRRNLDTEVKLHGPDGVVRWNMASLISDAEVAALAIEFSDRVYTLLLGLAEAGSAYSPGPNRQGPWRSSRVCSRARPDRKPARRGGSRWRHSRRWPLVKRRSPVEPSRIRGLRPGGKPESARGEWADRVARRAGRCAGGNRRSRLYPAPWTGPSAAPRRRNGATAMGGGSNQARARAAPRAG